MNEKVSIITPVYNCRNYLKATIESALAQTYTNWELLMVDDCSTDGSADVARHYRDKDPRIKLFTLAKNSGAAVARNHAISASTGRYIAFLDSDDVWTPDKLSRQLAFMQQNDYLLTYTAYSQIDEHGRILGDIRVPMHVSYHQLLKTNVIGCFTAIYDTKYFGKIKMPLIRKRQDFGLWLRLLKKIDYAHGMQEPLGSYRLRSDSVSSNKRQAAVHNWTLYREVENLSFVYSLYCFAHYATRGMLKQLRSRSRTN